MKRFKAYVNYLMNFYVTTSRIYLYNSKDIPAITGMSQPETDFNGFLIIL